jgi:hypothetical protein
MTMKNQYRMEVTKQDDDPSVVRVKLFVADREGGWDHELSDYCLFTGICSPERAEAILAALNTTAVPAHLEAAE